MAHVVTEYCGRCETDTTFVNGSCSSCSMREYREMVGAWNALTVDEKLTDLRKRMEKLEHGPARY